MGDVKQLGAPCSPLPHSSPTHLQASWAAWAMRTNLAHPVYPTLPPSLLYIPAGELGGKSALIIFDDADIEQAVEWVMFGAFWTNGQICSSTSRILIHERCVCCWGCRGRRGGLKLVGAVNYVVDLPFGPMARSTVVLPATFSCKT